MNEYLTGVLSFDLEIDTVFLQHKLSGRWTQIALGEGDLILIEDGKEYKTITISDIKGTIDEDTSPEFQKGRIQLFARERNSSYGQSLYEDTKAKVKLNPETTTRMESINTMKATRELLRQVADQRISYEEAMETLGKWERVYGI